MASKRLFVAVPVSEELRQVLASCNHIVTYPRIRWTPPENLHITLLFLGDVAAEKIPDIKSKLATMADVAPFQLHCEEITVVQKRGRACMIWARFKQEPAFVALVKKISATTGMPLDRYPLPHITLARLKSGGITPIHRSLFPAIWHLTCPVEQIALWESQLNSTGSVYSVLEEWHLRQGEIA